MSQNPWREWAKQGWGLFASLLFRRDRWTHTVAFLAAVAFHIPLLMMGSHQYLQAATQPQSANQAAQRVSPMVNDQGKPIKFVYVKDSVPSPDIPNRGAAASDMTRRGASPDPRKGDSPDPTSRGNSALRQLGGPGNAPFNRPAVPPSAASPRPEPAQPRAAGDAQGRQAQAPARSAQEMERAVRETQGTGSGARSQTQGQPVKGEDGLPVGGENEGGAPPQPKAGGARPGAQTQPRQGQQGLGTQLQQMSAGAMQGGFNNPNASRLNTGDVSFDTAGWDLGPYARQVQERVQSNWRTPEAQMVLRQKGWVAVHFNVQRDGRITDLEVVRSSGIPSYDQSAMDALRSSNPLPPLPAEVTLPKVGALFRFFYNMPSGG